MKNIIKTIGLVGLATLAGCTNKHETKIIEDPAFINLDGLGKVLTVYGKYKGGINERLNEPDGFVRIEYIKLEYDIGHAYPTSGRNLPYLEMNGDKGTLHLRYDEGLTVTRLH